MLAGEDNNNSEDLFNNHIEQHLFRNWTGRRKDICKLGSYHGDK